MMQHMMTMSQGQYSQPSVGWMNLQPPQQFNLEQEVEMVDQDGWTQADMDRINGLHQRELAEEQLFAVHGEELDWMTEEEKQKLRDDL